MIAPEWTEWLAREWPRLCRPGGRAEVPAELGSPEEGGLAPLRVAEPVGQVGDWGAPLPNGSRLHVHELADGSLVAHVDRIDPGRGPLSALRHWLAETEAGSFVGARALGLGLGLAWGRWYAGRGGRG